MTEHLSVTVPLVLVTFIAERFIAVDTADKLALAALKSYIQARADNDGSGGASDA